MARQPVTPIAEMGALTQSQRMRLVEEYRACGLEPNTIRGREWADKAWINFCASHKVDTKPTTFSAQLYMAIMSECGYSWSSITKGISAMKRAAGSAWASIESDANYALVRSAAHKKVNLQCHYEAPPIRIEEIVAMRSSLNMIRYNDVMAYLLVATGFVNLHRLGELCDPDDDNLVNPNKRIQRDTFKLNADGIQYRLPYSKTDRFYNGVFIALKDVDIPPELDLRPIWRIWLEARDRKFGLVGPLWLSSTGVVPRQQTVIETMRRVIRADLSGRSLRAGGATYLASRGATAGFIKARGRWSSDAYRLYVRSHEGLPVDET